MARKRKNEKLVASIAAFREDGKLLFGLRADNHRYSLPGGHLEEGEEHLKAAVRELLEETGLKPTALKYLGHGLVRKTRGNVRVFCYEARVEGEPSGKNDPDKEFGVFRWVDPKDIPADVSENLHSKNNVTLRLLDLQEGEVRKFEDELDDLSKEESDGDISKPPLFLQDLPQEEWLKFSPEHRYELIEHAAKRMAHPPVSMKHLLSQETWDQLPPELRLKYETLADHAKHFDRSVETTTFPPNTPEEKELPPAGGTISPDDWMQGLWTKYLHQHPNIDVPAPGSEDGWQAHSPEERHHKWESYHAGTEGGYLQDEHRRWQLHEDPIKADPIESMLVDLPGPVEQVGQGVTAKKPGPAIGDQLLALKLPGVTRRHVQIALDAEFPSVRKAALQHPLVDKRHLQHLIEQPRNPIANGTTAQQYRGKALDINEALSHPLMDDSLLDSCVKAYQHIPAEAANSPDTLNWVHKFAEHPGTSGDMIARCLERSEYKEGQLKNDWGNWLHSSVLVLHPKLPQGWIADRIKDWDSVGDDQWNSSKRAKAKWAQVMLGHPNVPTESLELVGKEGRKLLRQEPGGAHDAMTRVPLEQLAKAKNLPSNEIVEWARALKPYDDRNVSTYLKQLLSNPNTDSKALDQVASKPDYAAFVGRHPAATDTQLSRCFDAMTDSMGMQGYDFQRQAQDLTDLLNNPRTPSKILDRAVKLATKPGTKPGTVIGTARCTRLSDDQYSALIASRMPEVSDGLEKNPALSAEHLQQMVSSPDSAMVHAALQRPYTVPSARAPLTAESIDTAMKSPDVKVRLAAVDNPVTTPDQLLHALKDPTNFPWTVSRADGQGLAPTLYNPLKAQGGTRFNAPALGMATVLSPDDRGRPNKNVGPEHVTALLQHPDPMAQARGASDPSIDAKMLQLLVDTNERLAPAVASNPSLNAVQQLSLAQKASGSVLQALNNNPSLSPETIRHLHTNHQLSNWDHPNIPEDVIHDELVSGEDERVRHQALRHPNLGSSTVDELKRQFANRRLQHEGGGLLPPPIWSKRVATPWSEATLPLKQSVWQIQTREDQQFDNLVHQLTADAHPDYQFKESTQVRPGMQKLRKLRDIIKQRNPTSQTASPKDLPPGDWSAGRLPNGNISAQKLDEVIKAVKPMKFNLSSTKYAFAQLHNSQPSKVLQVNLSSDHVKQMRQHGVYDTFKAMNEASQQSEHPVLPQTLGWIRYTGDSRNGYFIDEIQSDFGQSFVKQAAQQARENGQDPDEAAAEAQKRWPDEHYNVIKQILFGGQHPNQILHEAFLQHLRDKGFTGAKVQIHSVESKAPISLGKALPIKCATCGVNEADHPEGPGTDRAALKHPFVPDPADGGEHIWCAHPGCGGKLSSPNHTPAGDHNFVAGAADRLKAPAHMNVTYHDVPKKMGYEPSTYGKLKTQNGTWDANDIGEGAPTWEGKVRKTEPLAKMAMIHDDPSKPLTLYRMQGPSGRGPYSHSVMNEHGVYDPKLDPIDPGQHSPEDDFSTKDQNDSGLAGGPGDPKFAFLHPAHAHKWFGRAGFEQLKGLGYTLQPVQASKVWRSDSGSQVMYHPFIRKSEAGFRNKSTGAVHRTGSTHDLLQLPEGIDTNPEDYEDGFMIDGEFVPRDEAVVHDAPHASDKVRKDEHLIWLAGLPLNKMAMIPKDLSPVARYHDPVAHTYVDDSNEEQANPAEHDYLKSMFKQHVIDDPQDVKRGRTGTRESSNSTGKVVYDIKSDVNKWPKSSVDRFMVKPYHEKIVPRMRNWLQHPIQGWAEMTNQALYHAGGIGDLHQRVHVARVPLEIKGPKARNNTTAWHNEFWTPEMKRHQLDSIISGPAYGSKYSRNELAGMYSDFLAAKQAEVAKTQAKLPKDRQETAPALVLHMQPQVSTIEDMRNYEFKPDVQAQARQIGLMDFLTNNLDRHSTNLLYDHANQKLLAIDHSRSFQYKNSDKRPLPKMATPYDSLRNYLKGTAIGHLLPFPERYTTDPKTGTTTRDDARHDTLMEDWTSSWNPTMAWWKKHSEPIKAQMNKRLELIRDNTVREHVRANFMRRTRMIDDWAKHGVRNFGGADFLNNELPITKPGEVEP